MNKERYIELLENQIEYLKGKIDFCEKTERLEDLSIYKDKLDLLKKVVAYPLYIKIISSNEIEIDDYISEHEQKINIEKERLIESINNINISNQQLNKELQEIESKYIYEMDDLKKEELITSAKDIKENLSKNDNLKEYINNRINYLDLESDYVKDETKVGLACQTIGLLLSNPETVKTSIEEIINSNSKSDRIRDIINDENKKKEFLNLIDQLGIEPEYTVNYSSWSSDGKAFNTITGPEKDILNYVKYEEVTYYNDFIEANKLRNLDNHIDKLFEPHMICRFVEIEKDISKIKQISLADNTKNDLTFFYKNANDLVGRLCCFNSQFDNESQSLMSDLTSYFRLADDYLSEEPDLVRMVRILKDKGKMTKDAKLMDYYEQEGMTYQFCHIITKKIDTIYNKINQLYKQKLGYKSLTYDFKSCCRKLYDGHIASEFDVNQVLNAKNQIDQQKIEVYQHDKNIIKKISSMLENSEAKFDKNSELTNLVEKISNTKIDNSKDNIEPEIDNYEQQRKSIKESNMIVSEFDYVLNNADHIANVFSPELLEMIINNNQLTDVKKNNYELLKNTIADVIKQQKPELSKDEIINEINNPDFNYETYINNETSDKKNLMDNLFCCNLQTNYVLLNNNEDYKAQGAIQVKPDEKDKVNLAQAIKISKIEVEPGKYQLIEENVSVPIIEYNEKMKETKDNFFNTNGREMTEDELKNASNNAIRYIYAKDITSENGRKNLEMLLSNGHLITDYDKYKNNFEERYNNKIVDNINIDEQKTNTWNIDYTFMFDNRTLDENRNIMPLSKQLENDSIIKNEINEESLNKQDKINQITENNNVILELQKQLETLKQQNATLEQSLNIESDGISI